MKMFGGSDQEIIVEITMTVYIFPEFHDLYPILPLAIWCDFFFVPLLPTVKEFIANKKHKRHFEDLMLAQIRKFLCVISSRHIGVKPFYIERICYY